MKCQTRIAGLQCVYDTGHTWPHLCRTASPLRGESSVNGGLMARFLASCPGSERCSCGSPMRSDGAGCTRWRCVDGLFG